MKYFTKEWYELCQKISFHLLLEEKTSRNFFRRIFSTLYKRKLGDYIEHKPFDKERAIEQFYNKFIYNQEYIKKVLPEDILKEIADIRVFVLDKATHKVINAVTQFCEKIKSL